MNYQLCGTLANPAVTSMHFVKAFHPLLHSWHYHCHLSRIFLQCLLLSSFPGRFQLQCFQHFERRSGFSSLWVEFSQSTWCVWTNHVVRNLHQPMRARSWVKIHPCTFMIGCWYKGNDHIWIWQQWARDLQLSNDTSHDMRQRATVDLHTAFRGPSLGEFRRNLQAQHDGV